MEVVAAVSSIAGIVGLVGQSIDGVIKLRNFFVDVSSASKTVELLLQDLSYLLRVLYDVEKLLCMFSASDDPGESDSSVATLQVQLKDCCNDTFKWLRTAGDLRPDPDSKMRMKWSKRLWVGVNQKSVKSIRDEIGTHKQTIGVSLSILGRKLDLQLCFKMNQINNKVDQLSTISLSTREASLGHQEVLERIESYSRTNMNSSAASIRSLDSVATSLSNLERLVTSSSGTPTSPKASSAALTTPFPSRSAHRDGMLVSGPTLPRIKQTARTMLDDHHDRLQQLTEKIFPQPVANYIASSRLMYLFRGQLSLVEARLATESGLEQLDKDYAPSIGGMLLQKRELESRFNQLQKEVKEFRMQCLQSGYPLIKIDNILSQASGAGDELAKPTVGIHHDMLEIRRRTLDSSLLTSWTDTRDRINLWLLHSLRSDDGLAHLHQSMLAEQDLAGKVWAQLVVQYWTLDEAAMGVDITGSLSVGATNSHGSSSIDSVDFKTCYGSQSDDNSEVVIDFNSG